jgi:hypothetical protein
VFLSNSPGGKRQRRANASSSGVAHGAKVVNVRLHKYCFYAKEARNYENDSARRVGEPINDISAALVQRIGVAGDGFRKGSATVNPTKLLVSVLVGVSITFGAFASSPAGAPPVAQGETGKIRFTPEQLADGPGVGYQLVRTFLNEEQWQEMVDVLRRKFSDWEKENDGDIGRYLNDRFIVVALGAVSGDIEKIKKGIIWLAYYKEFGQQAPGVVRFALMRHRDSLSRLFENFSWEKAAQYIKNKEWRKDNEQKKVSAAPKAAEKGS